MIEAEEFYSIKDIVRNKLITGFNNEPMSYYKVLTLFRKGKLKDYYAGDGKNSPKFTMGKDIINYLKERVK